MAGFRKDRTTAAQTAANVAGEVTSARIANGELKGAAVDKALTGSFQALFDLLGPVVDADNIIFAEAEAASPTPIARSGGGYVKKGDGKAGVQDNPGDTTFFGGKFKGCTVAEVYGMTEEEAKDRGHQFGSGDTYITNYVATDKNTNDTTRNAAKAYLAGLAS